MNTTTLSNPAPDTITKKKLVKIGYILILIGIMIAAVIIILYVTLKSHTPIKTQPTPQAVPASQEQTSALAQDALAKYHALLNSTEPLSFKALLPVMDGIQAAEATPPNQESLKSELDKADAITTHKLFLPLLANRYEHAIIKNLKKPVMLYPFLNAYMMLTQPKAADSNTLLITAAYIIPEAHQDNFKTYLAKAIQPPFQGLPEQSQIVDAARKSFDTLSLDQQATVVLLNQDNRSVDLLTPLQWFTPADLKTPILYTTAGFNNAIKNFLPIAADSVLYGNLALGVRQNSSIDPNDLSKLVYTLYLTQYANYWASILTGIHLQSVNNLTDLNNLLSNLGNNQSELTHIINILHDNTDMPEINPVNVSLRNINQWLDAKTEALTALQLKFADTLSQLNSMSKTDRIHWVNQNIEIGNFNPISLDITLPTPLNDWLTDISQRYWQLNLNAVLSDINQAWQTQIYNVYQQQFFEHFPFAAREFPDANLNDFTTFFKPNGILDTFIQENLGSFINTKRVSWQLRQIPGLVKNGFAENSNMSVATLQKLHAITQMFFNNTLHPTLQFSLAPILMTPNIKQVAVKFNKITLTANSGSPNLDIPITWQLNPHDQITLNFLDDNNQIVSFAKSGTWAWLRILADNKVQALDPNRYYLQFDSGVLQAEYKLTTDNPSNPFELSVLSDLAVPETFFN